MTDTIETVSGQISAEDLGYTLIHEHLFVHDEGIAANYPELWNRDRAILTARKKLNEAFHRGIHTIVDMTVLGNGRNIRDIVEVAKDVPVNILCATGVYYLSRLPGYFHSRPIFSLKDCMVRDIREGISGTAIKAAVIKTCTDLPGVTADVDKSLRAASRAHLETGAPILTHANAKCKSGLLQAKVFREEGVMPEHVCIGHVMDSDDLSYAEALLDLGYYIGFDRFSTHLAAEAGLQPAAQRLYSLCQNGFSDKILIGNDGCSAQTVTVLSHAASAQNDYTVFTSRVVPILKSMGMPDSQINKLTVENPRRFLAKQFQTSKGDY